MWDCGLPVSIIVSSGLFSPLFTVILPEEIADHIILGAFVPLRDTSNMFVPVAKRIPPQLKLELLLATFIYLLFSPIRILLEI